MSAQRRRVITAHEVETAAYAGAKELHYDERSSIVTPLARSRANDLGVALRASSGGGAPPPPSGRSRATPPAAGERPEAAELSPELAAEVLRRVQRRLEQQ